MQPEAFSSVLKMSRNPYWSLLLELSQQGVLSCRGVKAAVAQLWGAVPAGRGEADFRGTYRELCATIPAW